MAMKKKILFSGILILGIISCSGQTQLQKKQAEASVNLAEAYISQEDYTAALKELLKAESLSPDDPHIHNDLGIVYMAKERLELAVKHYEKAVQLKPSFAPARNNLGTAYLAMKNWDKAIETLMPLTEDLLYTTPHYPLTNLGWAYFNKKEYETAAQYYSRAVKKEPNYVIAARGLGKAYIELGKPADAIPVFEKAMELAPRFAEVYVDAGKAYAMIGDKAKAVDVYKKFLAMSPNHPRAEEARKMMLVLDKK